MRTLAVVTGASSGLGAGFADRLAVQGYDLMLVARRRARLEAVAQAIEAKHRVSVEIREVDLSDAVATRAFADHLAALDNVEMLVNSAGFGTNGRLVEIDPLRLEQELYVDLIALAMLNRAVLPQMLARSRGAIINISSLGGLNPAPFFAPYAGSKAGVISFTQSLHGELKGTGVRVQALCPGAVPTEFNQVAEVGEMPVPGFMIQSVEDCVDGSLRDLARNRPVSIPHMPSRVMARIVAMMPLSWRLAIVGSSTSKAVVKRRDAVA
jgi:short-subunit dehydrogenase